MVEANEKKKESQLRVFGRSQGRFKVVMTQNTKFLTSAGTSVCSYSWSTLPIGSDLYFQGGAHPLYWKL